MRDIRGNDQDIFQDIAHGVIRQRTAGIPDGPSFLIFFRHKEANGPSIIFFIRIRIIRHHIVSFRDHPLQFIAETAVRIQDFPGPGRTRDAECDFRMDGFQTLEFIRKPEVPVSLVRAAIHEPASIFRDLIDYTVERNAFHPAPNRIIRIFLIQDRAEIDGGTVIDR